MTVLTAYVLTLLTLFNTSVCILHVQASGSKDGQTASLGKRPEADAVVVSYGLIKEAVTEPGAAAYLGCFSTSDQWSVETAHMTSARGREAGHDVTACVEDCWEQRARFAVIGRGGNCMCGGLVEMMSKADDSLCAAPCVSNSSLACGGTTALDVYYTGYIEEPKFDVISYDEIRKVYQGCYEDPPYATMCPYYFTTTRLNVQMCMEICSNNFYKYAALDSPQKCCCTSSLKGAYLTKPGLCNLLCETGRGKHESCGGDQGFLAVYVTGTAQFEGVKPKAPNFVWMRPRIDESVIHQLTKVVSQEREETKS